MFRSSEPLTKLLTGVPRSGTTLCCKLLNQLNNTVALHEPIDPQKLSIDDSPPVLEQLQTKIKQLRQALINGEQFEHGDNSQLSLDNPISNEASGESLRPLSAKRGLMQAPSQHKDVKLIVKQNALFAALSLQLAKHFEMVAIVRNPIDVLLSWMTVDLPVNRGRLPAGERFDGKLANALKAGSVLDKQMAIYQWFVQCFINSGIKVVRYEDIVASHGAVLFDAFGFEYAELPLLSAPQRRFSASTLAVLTDSLPELESTLSNQWYTREDIQKAYERVLSQTVVGS